ncbi:hypothetical protein [Nocardia coffeae]|nr:hypothetical protein [Nocardia coffeae]
MGIARLPSGLRLACVDTTFDSDPFILPAFESIARTAPAGV